MKIEIDEIRDLIFKYADYAKTWAVTEMMFASRSCDEIHKEIDMLHFRAIQGETDTIYQIKKAIEAYKDEKVRNEFREFHRWLLNSEIDEKSYVIIMKQLRKQVNKYRVFDRTEGKY